MRSESDSDSDSDDTPGLNGRDERLSSPNRQVEGAPTETRDGIEGAGPILPAEVLKMGDGSASTVDPNPAIIGEQSATASNVALHPENVDGDMVNASSSLPDAEQVDLQLPQDAEGTGCTSALTLDNAIVHAGAEESQSIRASALANVQQRPKIAPIASKLKNIIRIPAKPLFTQTPLPSRSPTRPSPQVPASAPSKSVNISTVKPLPLRVSYPTPAYPLYQHLPTLLDALKQRMKEFWDVFGVWMMMKDVGPGRHVEGHNNESGNKKSAPIVFGFEGEYSVVGGGMGDGKGGKKDWEEREWRVKKVRKIIQDMEKRIGVRFT